MLTTAELLADINPTPAYSFAPVEVGGITYFPNGDAERGVELWRTDGTAVGTRMVKDINPGADSSHVSKMTDVDGTLYFIADDGQHGFELWKSNWTEADTVLVKDISLGANTALSPSSVQFVQLENVLFFCFPRRICG